MNKEKILKWVKANKKSVGIIGGALVGVLLFGGGYGIYKYTNKPLQVAENKESDTLLKKEETAEGTSDKADENIDGKKDNEENGQVDNQENKSEDKTNSNKTENKDEKSSSSENNKKEDGKQSGNKASTQDGKASGDITIDSGNKQTSSSVNNKPTNKPSSEPNPSHSHTWTPVTKVVHHKEQGHYENVLVKPAWTEKVPVYEEREVIICNDCGAELSVENRRTHVKNHILNGGKGSWREEWKNVQVGTKTVKHEAVYNKKWIVDKKAYDEKVTTGYKCSCGATK